MFKFFLAWLPMVLIAILNGVLREKGYRKYLGELRAHLVSTLLGMILLGLYIWGITRLLPLTSADLAWRIGFLWSGLTIVFEFGFGHFVMGHSWRKLLQDYNLLKGRVWLLVLIWVTVAPYIFFKLG